MMWFDKYHPDAIYCDKRKETHTLCDGSDYIVLPDIQADFRSLPFPDNSFHLVVFDPPHMKKLGKSSWLAKKYGVLLPTWETDIKGGFDECMRVLKTNGTLIFKWNDVQIKASHLVGLFGQTPLFGHPTAKHGKTIWMAFMKR